MSLIYEPRGKAREYAALACNVYSGCDHACVYCYAPSATFKKFQDFINSKPRPNFRNLLINELKKWNQNKDQVLLSFTCDPYQKLDEEIQDTRFAIQSFHQYGFGVCVLTKGGKRSLRDIDLFGAKDAFASTMTFVDHKKSIQWEPGSALPEERMEVIEKFYNSGIETWISLEPTIDPEQSLEIIRKTHNFVDLYKIGKLNYHPLGKTIDWKKYTEEATQLVLSYDRNYLVKNDLKSFIPHGLPQDSRSKVFSFYQ